MDDNTKTATASLMKHIFIKYKSNHIT